MKRRVARLLEEDVEPNEILPVTSAPERTQFSHILVDEYQDLNRAEQSVIDLLSGNADVGVVGVVGVVGDDDQSIYSFKYALPEGIREWLDDNEGADDDLTLEECRRCPTRVVGRWACAAIAIGSSIQMMRAST